MKLKNSRITLLINSDHTSIELIDYDANITFAKVTLNPAQLSQALARTGYVECEIEVFGLDKLGKVHENKTFEFEIPEKASNSKKELFELAKQAAPAGWIPDNYFSSQNTFFHKDGKLHARTTIRRWI